MNLVVRYKNQNIFLQTNEEETILNLKKEIKGILGFNVEDQKLYFKHIKTPTPKPTDAYKVVKKPDTALLNEIGYFGNLTEFDQFNEIGLTIRVDGEWQPLEIKPMSQPPELPDCMKGTADPKL